MKIWIAMLKVFGYVWLILGVIAVLIGVAGTWIKGGFSAVQELMSPVNVVNWVVHDNYTCARPWSADVGTESRR